MSPKEIFLFLITLIITDEAALSTDDSGERPLINTPLGAVKGTWQQSFEGRRYASFEGIPYAQPPIGNLRFEEPRPIKPWTGIWDASRLFRCTQYGNGEEDCLYINVYIPEMNKKENLDVIVHIHGGGFIMGGTNDFVNPKYVMDIDAIFVTFTYRLGIFGFLCTEDEVVPGNNGLKDQTLALKWIQSNIASFGGNPELVTLTGFSAGAVSVHLQYFSPMNEGFFKRGFSLSGTALNSWAIQRNPRSKAETVASVVGCPTIETKSMVECLKTKPATLLIDSMKSLQPLDRIPFCLFGPVVEKNNSANAFLPEHPYEMLKNGKVLDIPWMTSVTENDGLFYLHFIENNYEQINSQWEEVADLIMDYNGIIPESQYADAARRIRDFYFPKGVSMSKENYHNFEKMFTDWIILLPAEQAVSMHSKIANTFVYYFRLSYLGQNSFKDFFRSTLPDIEGTCHGDDMVYFFGGMITKDLSENEIQMKNSCLNMLHSYAEEGHPVFHNTILDAINNENEVSFYNISGPQDIQKQIRTQNAAISLWTDIMGYSNA